VPLCCASLAVSLTLVERAGAVRKSEEARESDDIWLNVCNVCLEYLLHINRTEVLFRDIYSMFLAADKQELFLQLLEPCILSNRFSFAPLLMTF